MLTTVRTANLTPMMENGRITERSSHEKQLLIPTKLPSESHPQKILPLRHKPDVFTDNTFIATKPRWRHRYESNRNSEKN
ncbi:MAG: hypothetical protein PUC47_09030 [Oscillospiraceae bacterium]|nr:hypothetical protein [Oscillospiraceae bacterium]